MARKLRSKSKYTKYKRGKLRGFQLPSPDIAEVSNGFVSQPVDENCNYWDNYEIDALNADDIDTPLLAQREPEYTKIQKLTKKEIISSLHSFGLDAHLIFTIANDDTPEIDAEKRKVTAVNRLVDFLEWVSDNCNVNCDSYTNNDEYVLLILDQAILKISVMLPGYVNLLSGMYLILISLNVCIYNSPIALTR
jgi:hypothetical protein